jgi:hypothetical protein
VATAANARPVGAKPTHAAAAVSAAKRSPLPAAKTKPAWESAERRSATRPTNVSRLPTSPKVAPQPASLAKAAGGGDDEWESF